MNLTLQRTHILPNLGDRSCTLGTLTTSPGLECVTLERLPTDPDHPCIPAGTYRLALIRGTPKDREWKVKLGPLQDGMITLCDVPGHSAIEMHPGNTVLDTLGCLCVGTRAFDIGRITQSRKAYGLLYPPLHDALSAGEPCFITIKDPTTQGTNDEKIL